MLDLDVKVKQCILSILILIMSCLIQLHTWLMISKIVGSLHKHRHTKHRLTGLTSMQCMEAQKILNFQVS